MSNGVFVTKSHCFKHMFLRKNHKVFSDNFCQTYAPANEVLPLPLLYMHGYFKMPQKVRNAENFSCESKYAGY